MTQLMLLCAAALSVVLAGVVIASNHTKAINRAYFFLSLTAAVWLVANALVLAGPLTPDSPGLFLLAGRLITPSALILSYFMMLLILLFTKKSQAWSLIKYVYLALLGLPIAILSFTDLNLSISSDKSLLLGPLYVPFVVVVITYLSIASYLLFLGLPSQKDSTYSAQAKYLRNAFLISVVPAATFGAILPLFTTSDISNLGPIFSTIFLLYTAQLIIKHRLFDVKPVVAKVIAYALLLSTVLSLFGFFTFFVVGLLNITNEFVARQLIPFGLAVVIAFLLRPIKRFFDRLTNKLFYQDAYDPQDFLDELNQVLASTIELRALLQSSGEIIERNLKAEFCAFAIHETSYESRRMMGNEEYRLNQSEISEVLRATEVVDGKVFVADYLENGQYKLKRVLGRNNVAVLANLTSSIQSNADGVGYILMGAKKSGNPYNSQDVKILEIIANELVIAIQNALRFEEIRNFNVTLQDEVRKATQQLEKTNERLRLLDETKDDFISMASHQLRTPLTSVKGYLSMVLEGDAGKVNPRQEKLLNQAFISSQRMVYLIADLLNVSRLRTGKFVVESTPVNLAEVIEGEVGQLKETAAARGLKLEYSKPKSFPTLMLDETKIRQVIMNFIDNAIYYTPSGGHIWVALTETDMAIEFTVKDDGIGVPKHEQHHLFTKFYRAGNARKVRPDGTGLGLFMAKKVIIAQGGSIIFKSQEGKGSTFGFTFAKARLQLPAQKAP